MAKPNISKQNKSERSMMQMVLTQSVVKGAPLAISIRTSSSCPDRAASSSFFPKSTKDI